MELHVICEVDDCGHVFLYPVEKSYYVHVGNMVWYKPIAIK